MTEVSTDMQAHTVTVDFDDSDLEIGSIISALANAGYTVPDYRQVVQ